jgi:hypothetical protein
MKMNRRHFNQLLVGSFASLGLAGLHTHASAQLVNKTADQLKNGEFNWFPERAPGAGPLLIIVSIPDQLLHVYRNGIRIAASTVSTGKPGHSTPTGVFTILQKDKHHRSSTYNNAPMPNMNRLTWSGIALHAGQLPGYPASHGCVRLPLKFSEMLFGITKVGMTVVLADNKSQPASVVHPGMVLGDYARHEFLGVDAAIKKSQYSAGHSADARSTSIVVSAKDRTMTVWEDDKIVATGGIEVRDSHRPLPESVHKLTAVDHAAGDLKWSSVGYGKTDREDLSRELRRIKAEPKVREEARKRMHHGMTLVTTNESSTASNRSSRDFVIIDGLY